MDCEKMIFPIAQLRAMWYHRHMPLVLYIKSTDMHPDRCKLEGLTERASAEGWSVQTAGPFTKRSELSRILRLWRPDGVVVNRGATANAFGPECYGGVATVFFHHPSGKAEASGVSYVCNDSRETAALAAKELMTAGAASFLFVGDRRRLAWNESRRDSLLEIARLHDRKAAAVETSDAETQERRLRAMADAIAAMPRPVGVFASTDSVGAEAIAACKLAGLSVPEDAVVIGVDNDETLCETTKPTLSSVDLDYRAAGRRAADMLKRLMAGHAHGCLNSEYPPLRVVRRESTHRFTRSDAAVSRAVELIRREACNGLSAAEVLKTFDCSRRMAEMRFRAAVGHSVLEEIRSVRLDLAKRMLSETNVQIGAIANQCGYDTAAAFTTFFKSMTGILPRDWRTSSTRHRPAN